MVTEMTNTNGVIDIFKFPINTNHNIEINTGPYISTYFRVLFFTASDRNKSIEFIKQNGPAIIQPITNTITVVL
ncbi:MAG: hypothetical protein Wins2KO_11900 [Winogradskyella sp.]